jgi:hypothetical protein
MSSKATKTARENAAYIAGRLDAQALSDLYHAGRGHAPDLSGFPEGASARAAATLFGCDELGRRSEVYAACEAAGCKVYKFDAVLLALVGEEGVAALRGLAAAKVVCNNCDREACQCPI